MLFWFVRLFIIAYMFIIVYMYMFIWFLSNLFAIHNFLSFSLSKYFVISDLQPVLSTQFISKFTIYVHTNLIILDESSAS